jgi:hypothetical protein
LNELLRSRFIAASVVTALLRHGATHPGSLGFQGVWFVDPQLGRAITPRHTFNNRLAGFAGRGFIANIDVAIAHDCHPLWKLRHNAQLPRKVARRSIESPTPMFWFTSVEPPSGFLHRKRLRSRAAFSNPPVFADVSSSDGWWRPPMRALSYIIAFAFVLAGPSLAGPADGDLPGIGTFRYNGSPIPIPAPVRMAGIGQ